ncbi:putative beta-lysine N-acetyltransferase [Phosphitispora sp. TUW77]|uniref:putative beta-lysine N-acetyltransferase n=1 Tax=Phosphitispora sp. TUW77 TaxID=3152361 RepID=UPI003AB86D8E
MIEDKGVLDLLDQESNLTRMSTPDFTVKVINDSRNQRIRVPEYQARDIGALASYLETLGRRFQAGKIIVYSHRDDWQKFQSLGYRIEGEINTFFRGEPMCFMSRFLSLDRFGVKCSSIEDTILKRILQRNRSCGVKDSSCNESGYTVRTLRDDDINNVMDIFKTVFATYPSPVDERMYFEEFTGLEGDIMMIAEYNGEIAGIISAAIDTKHLNAEITDCITLPEHRGRGVMAMLIDSIEEKLTERKLVCLYSLARAGVPPINAVMYKKGYKFMGRLINNCHIGGRFENMNIWEKSIG